MPNEATFGTLIRGARTERGQTLLDVAAEIGISVAYLSRIERDLELPPKDEIMRKLSRTLKLSQDELYAAARRFPPDLQSKAGEVIAAYRRSRN
jgi:transcriptional regulator with XRE-family HTH domain